MQTLTKEQIEPVLGKTSFWFPDAKKKLTGVIQYLGGVAAFEDISIADPVNLEAKPNGLLIEAMHNFKYQRVGLLGSELKSWVLEAQEQIFEQKEKSVVGRALIGGLLLGPVGAIVGGMSGIGTKAVKTGDTPENVLSLTYPEGVILFTVSNNKRAEVERFLQTNYPR